MKYVILFALYLGIGLFLHAIFVGPNINPASTWSWLWLLGWPAMLAVLMAIVLAVTTALFAWREGR